MISWGPGPSNSTNEIHIRTFALQGQWKAVLLFLFMNSSAKPTFHLG